MPRRIYHEDPEFPDESDPAYREEIFETIFEMKWAPEEIKESGKREEYRSWLKAKLAGS